VNTDPDLSFVAVTTRARRKRHWSEPPRSQFGLSPLCDTYAKAYDQEWVDAAMPAGWRKRKVIADMPPCVQCDKSRKRREEGRPQ
jgi:hypothetical protein